MCFLLIAGSNLPFLWRLAPGLLLLAFLLSGLAVLSLALTLKRIWMRRSMDAKQTDMRLVIPTEGRITRTAKEAAKLCFCFALGMIWANYQFTAKRFSYSDVLILARHDDRNFTLQPARMQPWEASLCSPADWQAGQKMKVLTYQQRNGCKDVAARGAFEFYADHGKRIDFNQERISARE